MKTMKDVFGVVMEVGDLVAYVSSGRNKGLEIGVIRTLSPKSVRIEKAGGPPRPSDVPISMWNSISRKPDHVVVKQKGFDLTSDVWTDTTTLSAPPFQSA